MSATAERGVPHRRGRGFGARGGRGFPRRPQQTHEGAGAAQENLEAPEVKSLRSKYGQDLSTVQAVFPEWDDESVLFALSEANGSVELAIARMAEGQAEQWGAVKPKKQPKKDSAPAEHAAAGQDGIAAGSNFSTRGALGGRGRGRGDFRGGRGGLRGGARGGRGGAVSSRPAVASLGKDGESTEATEVSVNADGSTTITSVAETSDGQLSITEATTDASGSVQQVEQVTIAPEQAPPAKAAASNNGFAQKAEKATPASAPSAKAAIRSWAQIARPPSPKPQPAAKAPAPAQPVAIIAEEVIPIVIPEADATTSQEPSAASQDPWSSTPAAAVVITESVETIEPALAVGEGWADSVIAQAENQEAQNVTADEQAALDSQHQRAEEAAPPAGVDPAGALDVHTPAAGAPTQQPAFSQVDQTSLQIQQSDKLAPPGLSKRSNAARGKQDAAVVMPGSTPDLEKMGVQFGSLNLFGSLPAPEVQQEQQQAAQPAQHQQHQQQQQSLYETPAQSNAPETSIEETVQQAQQAPAPYDIQQQAHAQYLQHQSGQKQQPASNYPSGFDRYGQQEAQQQQQQQLPSSSAYSSRYQPFGHSAQPQDPFASSAYTQNGQSNNAQSHQGAGLGGADSISPYYSAQQAQQHSGYGQQPAQSNASPAPAAARESAGSVPPQQAHAGYGGFQSAVGQAQHQNQQYQAQAQQGYPTDYASLYAMQDQRNLQNYYGQYDQSSQQSRPQTTEDLSTKLGTSSTAPTSMTGGLSQQGSQQQHQQQQQYPPNMMPYGGYPYYYGMPPTYGQPGMNPGYGGYASHHSPYGAYGAGYQQQQGRGGYPGANAQQQHAGYGRNAGGAGAYAVGAYGSGAAAAQQQQSNYSSAYGSFDTGRAANSSTPNQAPTGQQERGAANKDVFSDRFFGQNY